MGELETNEELNKSASFGDYLNNSSIATAEKASNDSNTESSSTAVTEYKEVDEPCVALTIIGENRLTDAEVFVRRGIKYSIKAFFSTLVLTIMNMFI